MDNTRQSMKMLPGDEVRQIMWRYTDRYDIQMAVQGARSVARGLIAKLVADGARNTHEWTEAKNEMYQAFDDCGITAAGLDPEYGGIIEGPRNFALALLAFELAWVDGGAATTSLVNNLALGPIVEKGTPEQRERYMTLCAPGNPSGKIWRGSFALTEPLPYVGVETGVMCGRVSVAEWKDGEEPMLKVEKRGRFITNMAVANFVTAAVDSADPKIKTSCMVILEETDPGVFDRGAPTLKQVHQLSNTHDPIFSLTVPASRIIGGYTIQDGVIVPNLTHSEIIEAVFARTRVTVGIMTAAKMLSSIEPVIRYQRGRFRGAAGVEEGSPRNELGIQMKEDAVQRLADVWACGEAAASLGFAIARSYDEAMPVDDEAHAILKAQGADGGRAMLKALKQPQTDAIVWIKELQKPEAERDAALVDRCSSDTLVKYVRYGAVNNILCPACKLWDTGVGTSMMREAVSMMGGYGITEDCPGWLFNKWVDGQLEATYEGPEVVQRRQISVCMNNPVFQEEIRLWIAELKNMDVLKPGRGFAGLADGFEVWQWAYDYTKKTKDAEGKLLANGQRHGVVFGLADSLAWLCAAYCFVKDVEELETKGPEHPVVGAEIEGYVNTFTDLAHVQIGRAVGETIRVCNELVYGYTENTSADVYVALVNKASAALAGFRMAKDRVARDLTAIMIPEALDYPQA